MSAQSIPFFHAIQDGYLYRVYVTSSDLVCVRLAKGPMPTTSESRMAIEINWLAVFCVTIAFLTGAGAGAFIGGSVFGTFGGSGPNATIFGYVTGGAIGAFAGVGAGWSAAHLLGTVMRPNAAPDEMAKFDKEVSAADLFLAKCREAEIRSYVKEKKCGYVLHPGKWTEARIDRIAKWNRLFFGNSVPALIVDHPSKGKCVFTFRKKADLVIAHYEVERLAGDNLAIAVDTDHYRKALKKYAKTRSS